MDCNYISLGYDCSPASALRNLGIRTEALPFDWVVSSLQLITHCIEDNFSNYHKDLQFNGSKKRLIDRYGFQFPHDYPLQNNIVDYSKIGEGIFGEETNKQIIPNWHEYHNVALEKYKRRIERFYSYLHNNIPLIILCRGYSIQEVNQFIDYLKNKFNKPNIYCVISSSSSITSNLSHIITCNTEKNGVWNEAEIWLGAIENIKKTII